MSFTDIFIRRPVLATVVSLMILLVGLAALFNLSVRQYPEITNTTLTITTAYPGANAELIRGFITTPLMSAVASAEGIDTLTSSSQQNVSTITLNLRLDANADRAVSDVLSKVQQVKNILPREAQDPIVTRQTGDTTALRICIDRVIPPMNARDEPVSASQGLVGPGVCDERLATQPTISLQLTRRL